MTTRRIVTGHASDGRSIVIDDAVVALPARMAFVLIDAAFDADLAPLLAGQDVTR